MSQQTYEKTRPAQELTPRVDIFENDSELLLVADVPGVEASDIGIHVELPEVRIEAKVPGAAEKPVYRRTFRVDERIDPERVKAEYKEGVLRVHLAKRAAFQPRRIAIQSS